MSISSFEDLLLGAAQQPDPQRMLFVFAEKGLPEDSPAGQVEKFRAESGGTLSPVVCVDKAVTDVNSFAALVQESETTGQHWDIVLVACLAGKKGSAPSASEFAVYSGVSKLTCTWDCAARL